MSDLSDVARALANPVRFRIIRLLAEQPECRGADVFSSVPLAQSTISGHLAILREAGLVTSHTEGTASVYCLVPSILEDFALELQALAMNAPVCSDAAGSCASRKE